MMCSAGSAHQLYLKWLRFILTEYEAAEAADQPPLFSMLPQDAIGMNGSWLLGKGPSNQIPFIAVASCSLQRYNQTLDADVSYLALVTQHDLAESTQALQSALHV